MGAPDMQNFHLKHFPQTFSSVEHPSSLFLLIFQLFRTAWLEVSSFHNKSQLQNKMRVQHCFEGRGAFQARLNDILANVRRSVFRFWQDNCGCCERQKIAIKEHLLEDIINWMVFWSKPKRYNSCSDLTTSFRPHVFEKGRLTIKNNTETKQLVSLCVSECPQNTFKNFKGGSKDDTSAQRRNFRILPVQESDSCANCGTSKSLSRKR